MKHFIFLVALVFLFSCKPRVQSPEELIAKGMASAISQYELLYLSLPDDGKMPRSYDSVLISVKTGDWTSGFFPASMWYLYEYTQDSTWRTRTIKYTNLLAPEQYNIWTHDLGFMLYCSYGNGYRIIEDSSYLPIMINGAYSLCKRFNPKVGLIRSWDHGKWMYPVIIDNMMNLEYLFWAFKQTKDSLFLNVAISHANNTLNNHFRTDYSSYHVVDYDTVSGLPKSKETCQGYADESAWARGQAWGLYGFTMCYRETKDTNYLKQAQKIAGFILNHPNMPSDKVPYWDFNAPNIPTEERDASAAAVIASALIELSNYVATTDSMLYMETSKTILSTLSSPAYLAKANENGNFILKHSVGHKTNNSEVDVPLNYADYYFIEALLRLNKKHPVLK